MKDVQHVFIIGSKGIPAKYGGFETFVDRLTAGRVNRNVEYHVACMSDNTEEFSYNNCHCFNIKVPPIGAAKAVYYDLKALDYVLSYIERKKIEHAIVYILACRIGPLMAKQVAHLRVLGAKLYVNPDGHEWKRSKWNFFIKRYWKISERLMVKHADLLVCDSKNIEKYIQKDYKKYHPTTTYIAYGADIKKSMLSDDNEKLAEWYKKNRIDTNEYYLVVGRFVPENNYETMIREFMKSNTKRSLVIITDFDNTKMIRMLQNNTQFWKDRRIKFVGTVYDQELLKKIRENAYGYLHGHEVGGTNPSLLESLASTRLNLLLGVGFNREVAENGAVYWSKRPGSLAKVINEVDNFSNEQIVRMEVNAKKRVQEQFSWAHIIDVYEKLFMEK